MLFTPVQCNSSNFCDQLKNYGNISISAVSLSLSLTFIFLGLFVPLFKFLMQSVSAEELHECQCFVGSNVTAP